MDCSVPPRPPYEAATAPLVDSREHEGVLYKTYYWQPTRTIRGRVVVVHGFRDDVACYWALVDALTAAGFGVFYYDQVGEGLTCMVDGSVGINSTQRALESLDFFVQHQSNEIAFNQETDNLHLVSHSNGGGIMLTYLARGGCQRNTIRSFSTIGPLLKLCAPVPRWVTGWPGAAFAATSYGAAYRVTTPMTAEECTADEKMVAYINATCDLTTIDGAFQEVRDGILRGLELLANPDAIPHWAPILLCHGEADKVTSPTATAAFADLLAQHGHPNVKLIRYPNGRHSLHMDAHSTRTNVVADMLSFLNSFSP